MRGHGTRYSQKKEAAIAALLAQRSIEDAAKATGLAPRTIWRWLQLPDFQDAYRQARHEAFSQSMARLQQASSAAVSTLLKVMIDPEAPSASRVRAAECVLEHTARAFELDDIGVRISQLERTAQQLRGGQKREQR